MRHHPVIRPYGQPFQMPAPDHGLPGIGLREAAIRPDGFGNPGDGEVAHRIEREDMAECFVGKTKPVTFSECHEIIRDATGKMPNTMRVSLGLASNFADVYRFLAFAAGFRDRTAEEVGHL